MSVIPIISSAADVPGAVRHAERTPGSRWYVVRRAEALGCADIVPREWGITAAFGGDWSPPARDKAEGKGQAMEGGSFPIKDKSDLKRAIQAYGRAKNKDEAKKHIIKRARALGALSELPESWGVTASGLTQSHPQRRRMGSVEALTAAGWDNHLHPRDRKGRFIEVNDLINVFSVEGGTDVSWRGIAVGNGRTPDGRDYIDVHPVGPDGKMSGSTSHQVPVANIESAPPAKAHLNGDAPDAPSAERQKVDPESVQAGDVMVEKSVLSGKEKRYAVTKVYPADQNGIVKVDTDQGPLSLQPGRQVEVERGGDSSGGADPAYRSYAEELLAEAESYAEPDEDGETDPELIAQNQMLRDALDGGTDADVKSRADHLRQMLLISYADDEELPAPPGDALPPPPPGNPDYVEPNLDAQTPSDNTDTIVANENAVRDALTSKYGVTPEQASELVDNEADPEDLVNPDADAAAIADDIVANADPEAYPFLADTGDAPFGADTTLVDLPTSELTDMYRHGEDPDTIDQIAEILGNRGVDVETLDAPTPDAGSDPETSNASWDPGFHQGQEVDTPDGPGKVESFSAPGYTGEDGIEHPDGMVWVRDAYDNEIGYKPSELTAKDPSGETQAVEADPSAPDVLDGSSGDTYLSPQAEDNLRPIAQLLDVDSGPGSAFSGLKDYQFDSLAGYADDYSEDPESVPDWAQERLDTLVQYVNKYGLDPYDVIEFRRGSMNLGWAQEEQLRNILEGQSLEEQNSNALRNISDFLKSSPLANRSFDDEDPSAMTLGDLARAIDDWDMRYDEPVDANPSQPVEDVPPAEAPDTTPVEDTPQAPQGEYPDQGPVPQGPMKTDQAVEAIQAQMRDWNAHNDEQWDPDDPKSVRDFADVMSKTSADDYWMAAIDAVQAADDKGLLGEHVGESQFGKAPGAPSVPATDSAGAKTVRLMAQSAAKESTPVTPAEATARLDEILASDSPETAHKDMAKLMTELKLGGKQRKRYREALDAHFGNSGGDSAKVEAAEVADNLSPSNPVKERLAAKAGQAQSTPDVAPSAPDNAPSAPEAPSTPESAPNTPSGTPATGDSVRQRAESLYNPVTGQSSGRLPKGVTKKKVDPIDVTNKGDKFRSSATSASEIEVDGVKVGTIQRGKVGSSIHSKTGNYTTGWAAESSGWLAFDENGREVRGTGLTAGSVSEAIALLMMDYDARNHDSTEVPKRHPLESFSTYTNRKKRALANAANAGQGNSASKVDGQIQPGKPTPDDRKAFRDGDDAVKQRYLAVQGNARPQAISNGPGYSQKRVKVEWGGSDYTFDYVDGQGWWPQYVSGMGGTESSPIKSKVTDPDLIKQLDDARATAMGKA